MGIGIERKLFAQSWSLVAVMSAYVSVYDIFYNLISEYIKHNFNQGNARAFLPH